jgi:hypothetical protein
MACRVRGERGKCTPSRRDRRGAAVSMRAATTRATRFRANDCCDGVAVTPSHWVSGMIWGSSATAGDHSKGPRSTILGHSCAGVRIGTRGLPSDGSCFWRAMSRIQIHSKVGSDENQFGACCVSERQNWMRCRGPRLIRLVGTARERACLRSAGEPPA